MAVLNIRNLDPEVHKALRLRAAKAGRSMEAEAREIIAQACAKEASRATVEELQAIVDQMYGGKKPKSAVDDLIRERRREARREWSR
jgi:plasmid stability protein